MLLTRKIVLKHARKLLFLHRYKTQVRGQSQTEVLRDRASTYNDATIYDRHFITPTNNHTYILLQRQFITATFDHKDRLS